MNYSLLEELWDDYKPTSNSPAQTSTVSVSSGKKDKKSKRAGKRNANAIALPEDPLCQLYAKRNLSLDKPFAEDRCNDNTVYHRSLDPSPYMNDMLYKNVNITAEDSVYNLSGVFADDDDMYLMNAVRNSRCGTPLTAPEDHNEYVLPEEVSNQTPYYDDYLTAEDTYLTSEDNTTSEDIPVRSSVRRPDCSLNIKMTSEINSLRKDIALLRDMVHDMSESMKSDPCEVQYFDFAVFIFGGIIMIFIMEQFLQIGINMKKTNNSVNVNNAIV